MKCKLLAVPGLLAVILLSGCSSEKDDNRLEEIYKARQQIISTQQRATSESTLCVGLTIELKEAGKHVDAADKAYKTKPDHWWKVYNNEMGSFHDSMNHTDKLIEAARKANDCRKSLAAFTDEAGDQHVAFHISQARQDLETWDKVGGSLQLPTVAQAHINFAKRLQENPAAVSSNDVVVLRDTVYIEGDVDSHDGDSPRVKAHLRQAAFCVTVIREAQAKGRYYDDVVRLAEAEFKLVHDVRRNSPAKKECSKSEEDYDVKQARQRVELFDRLVKVGQEINERCPKTCAEVAMLKATEQLYASAVSGAIVYDRKFNEVAAAIDRLEDGLLRFKKCGK
jgi:hypothetical protein